MLLIVAFLLSVPSLLAQHEIIFPNGRPTLSRNPLPTNCGKSKNVINQNDFLDPFLAPIGAYPWMVALGYTSERKATPSFLCSGSIINRRYVLTGANCMENKELNLTVVRVRDWNLDSNGVDCQQSILGEKTCFPAAHIDAGVDDIIIHPDFNKRGKYSDDIALVRLDRALDFTSGWIAPVCLSKASFNNDKPPTSTHPILIGWGQPTLDDPKSTLHRVDLPFAQKKNCRNAYPNRIAGKQICAGGHESASDICFMTGSALVFPRSNGAYEQVGIMSFGVVPCGVPGFPDVFTFVGDYQKWISDTIKA